MNDTRRERRKKRAKRLARLARGDLSAHVENPSSPWRPMLRNPELDEVISGEFFEGWENWRYYASVRRFSCGFFLADSPYTQIGISSIDETARHDWRDFQRIKNDIVGDDWEAVELYPDESRLVDPSNRFYLWCVPSGLLKFGFYGRRVVDQGSSLAPQRPFPKQEILLSR